MILNRKIQSLQTVFTFKNFLLLAILLYLVPKTIYSASNISLDPSWRISLNLAIQENLIFGKDFIFTYGPLGYLSTGLPIYASKILIVLFYLFIIANGAYFIYYLFKSIERKTGIILVSVTLIFFGWFLFSRDALCLYFYFTFHIFHFIKHRNLSSFIIASVCCLLAFYVKVNVGLILNILFLLFITYNFLFKTINKIKNISFLIGHFIILYLLSFPLNTDIVSYIHNSLPIISSFNDAMVINPDKYEILTVGVMFMMVIIAISISIKKLFRSYHDMFIILNLLLFSFILFKSGFVRTDWHTILFYTGINFTLLLGYLFSDCEKLRSDLFRCIIVTVLLSASTHWGSLLIQDMAGKRKFPSYPETIEMSYAQCLNNRKLPARVIKEIGNKTVDVLGYETSYIYYNNLKYNPRPIIQSYSVYDKELININYDKYNSLSAPDYVLYHYGSIDDRNFFWDEPKTYLSLFRNYEIIDSFPAADDINSLMLFKKSPTSKRIVETVVLDTLIHFNTRFKIPVSENILYLSLDYNYTFFGKLKRLFFQPSLVYMKLIYDDSTSTTCRLVMPVMKSGVPINKKIMNFADAYSFFNSKGKENKNSAYLELSGNPKWINDSFKVRIIEYKIL